MIDWDAFDDKRREDAEELARDIAYEERMNAEETIQAFEAETMRRQIADVQRVTGSPVTFERFYDRGEVTLYAVVADNEKRAFVKCPGDTEAEAVDALFREYVQ